MPSNASPVTREAQEWAAQLEGLMHEITGAFYDVRAAAHKSGLSQDWGSSTWSILRTLEAGGPITMSELARRRSCSRQNIQKTVSEPIAKEWIRLDPNPADGRAPLMVITDAGRRQLKSHRRALDRALRSLSRQLAAEDVAKATATLALVRALLARQGSA